MTVGYGDLSRLPRRTEPWMAIKTHDFISKVSRLRLRLIDSGYLSHTQCAD